MSRIAIIEMQKTEEEKDGQIVLSDINNHLHTAIHTLALIANVSQNEKHIIDFRTIGAYFAKISLRNNWSNSEISAKKLYKEMNTKHPKVICLFGGTGMRTFWRLASNTLSCTLPG